MKLNKGVITRAEALKLSPDYVKFHAKGKERWEALDSILSNFENLRVGQKVLAYCDGQFVLAKVTSIRPGFEGEPVVRVGNGEYTWRADGNDYAFPI